MKAVTVATALAGAANAAHVGHMQAHNLFKRNAPQNETVCLPGCSTVYTTIYGEATWQPNPPVATSKAAPVTSSLAAPVTSSSAPLPPPPVTTSSIEEVTAPTPVPHVCPTPGTYTFPGTTITLTSTQIATITQSSTTLVTTCPPGTYTQKPVVTTVTDTSIVVYCPFETSSATSTSVSSSKSAPPPAPTTSEEAAVPSVPALTVSIPAVTTSKKAEPSYTSTPGHVGGDSNQWAMSYTPYDPATGACKSKMAVAEDVAKIAQAGFKVLRTYSTDCDTLDFVGDAARASGLRLMIGLFIGGPGCDNQDPTIAEQVAAIKTWGQAGGFDLVDLFVIGNEAVFQGHCTPAQLASVFAATKKAVRAAGYTGPCTTAETVDVLSQPDFKAALCADVDVLGANSHAYFDANTAAASAGTFVKGQLAIVDGLCPGKEGVILETGWPTKGNVNGKAVPGVENQKTAIKSIMAACGERAVIFSWFSDAWKNGDTACACEKFWGCGSLFEY